MALTGVMTTVLVSIPAVREALLAIATTAAVQAATGSGAV